MKCFVRLPWFVGLCAAVAVPVRAAAVCNVSACTATELAACCTPSACTIDGSVTVSASNCVFDFGTRSVVIAAGGQIRAQGKVVTLRASTVRLQGLIDVRGPNGADAGSVTIVTTGRTTNAYTQDGGTSAIINASSTNGAGGAVVIRADGPIAFKQGSVTADGGPASRGGTVDVSTTSGDVNIQLAISAISGTALNAAGISITTPGNVGVTGTGRLIADLGSIDVDASEGTATFAAGAVVQANAGGSITIVAGSVLGSGVFRANGEDGSVEITAATGPMSLSALSEGITVGPGSQSVVLSTLAGGDAGNLTMDMPILANGAEVDIESSGMLVVSKKITTTGILDSGAGDITLAADGDIDVSKAIVGSDSYVEAELSIDGGRDVVIEGNLQMQGGLDTPGGSIVVTAARDLFVKGSIQLNVSGADSSDAGSIVLDSGRNVNVASSVGLLANGSQVGAGGQVALVAGDGGETNLPGNVVLAGSVAARGHTSADSGNFGSVLVDGCSIGIPAGTVIDATGDANGSVSLAARASLTVGGQVKAARANVVEFAAGALISLSGTFTPAPSAGSCGGGTPTGNGCQRPICTGKNVPAGCLYACPTCGDGKVDFPETCDSAAGVGGCSGLQLCDDVCRLRTCAVSSPCQTATCDPVNGCGVTNKADGVTCDPDDDVCTGVGTCSAGACVMRPGSILHCDDANPCTGPDTCDPHVGCRNPPISGTGIPGCDDGNLCDGIETCTNGHCESGGLPCAASEVCNPTTQKCEPSEPCVSAADCVDDDNPCTQDACIAGFCSHPAFADGTSCDDGDRCNGLRTCKAGICQQPTAPVVCTDDDPCTSDVCIPATGACTFQPIAGCCHDARDCDDGDACTSDTCDASHTCRHGVVSCDDAAACTIDACDPVAGCEHTVDPSCASCRTAAACPEDDDPCTEKACVGGRCGQVYSATGCDDGDPCTTDVCASDVGCTHIPIASCCVTASACEDRNVCTVDGCDFDANRCVHSIADVTCTPCTGDDPFECGPRCTTRCNAGRCEDVAADCDDDDPCTADSCDPGTGCVHVPLDGEVAGCDDGQACNGVERCSAGVCRHEPVPACDDGDPCTDDDCRDDTGCVNMPKASFDAIRCRLTWMKDLLATASAQDIPPVDRRRLSRRVDKLIVKLEPAVSTALKCGKRRRLLAALDAQLGSLEHSASRVARRANATVAMQLAALARAAAEQTDVVRAALVCGPKLPGR